MHTTFRNAYTHAYEHTCLPACKYIYIHATHTHTHIYIYIYIYFIASFLSGYIHSYMHLIYIQTYLPTNVHDFWISRSPVFGNMEILNVWKFQKEGNSGNSNVLYVCINVWLYQVCMILHTDIYVCNRACMSVCMYICISIYTHVYNIYVFMHAWVCMYLYMHAGTWHRIM